MDGSTPDVTQDARIEAARKRGSRYLTFAFGSLAVVFVVLSVAQLIEGVFGLGLPAVGVPGPSALPTGACADRLRHLETAVDRAIAAASRARDDEQAAAAYKVALSPEWDDESESPGPCGGDGKAHDAFAAVLRLRRAGEDVARRQAVELGPLRQNVAAYLVARP